MKDKEFVKEHIIDTTIKMLTEGFNTENITIRKIATVSNVSTGLVNYHFGSKDKLLEIAVDRIMSEFTAQIVSKILKYDNPQEMLYHFLCEISIVVLRHEPLTKTLLHHEYFNDSYSTPGHIIELISKIRPELDDYHVRLLSIQVVAPLQYIFFKSSGYKEYMGVDEFRIEILLQEHLKILGLYN